MIYTAALGMGALLLFGIKAMGGVLAGGVITLLNLLWVSALVRSLIEESSAPRSFALKLVLKEILLLASVGVLIALKLVDAIGFIVGLSSLVLSVLIVSLRWGPRPGAAGDGAEKQ